MACPFPFDPYAKDAGASDPRAFADLGRKCPVLHYQGRFDFFIASDYGDVTKSILKDPSTWTIEQGSSPKLLPEGLRTALMTDSDYHTKVRYVVQRGFSLKEIERLSRVVERLADELIDTLLARPDGRGDLFESLIMPLPARLMCVMLGAPEQDFMIYKSWADKYFYDILNDPESVMDMATVQQVSEPFFRMLKERRALLADQGLEADLAHVGAILPNDFLSRFMCDKIDGNYLEDSEILSLMLGIIVGGNETTMNLIGNLLWRLLDVPERWDMLKANPDLIDAAIEESLRLDPPVIGLFRAARHDTLLHGEAIPKDAKIMYNVASANRNPEIWSDPDEFRLDRPMAALRKHIAFSAGNHACLGAPLARMEAKVVMRALIDRMPGLRLDGEPAPAHGFNVCGKSRLPVAWR